jgi:hypothetical protein
VGDVPPMLADHVVGPSSPNWDLEVLYHERRYRELLDVARARFAANPNDADLAWHMGRACYEIGEDFERTDTGMDKLAWYREMWDTLDKALAVRPGDPHLLFGRGIAIGRYGTTRGVLSSLFLAKRVEADWLAAASSGLKYRSIGGEEEIPCDVYQALSIFYRLVPDWFIVEVIAGTRGDKAKAVAYGEKAVACSPHRIRNLKELGVSQICLGQGTKDDALVQKGRATLTRGLGEVPVASSEVVDQRHLKLLLANPDLACAYSRDGQQELDRENLATP